MPDYRIRSTGEIITNLQMAFPNVSLPMPISVSDLDSLGVDPVLEGPQPILTRFQSAMRTGPEQESKGNWMWVYVAVDWTQEQIDQATAEQWKSVRADRDRRLQECDWTQLPDVPLTEEKKTEWVVYRQELRNITDQPDPFEIIWPTQPE